MAFGFQQIMDLSPLSLKLLNDQLELLWKAVMANYPSVSGASNSITLEESDIKKE